MAQKINVMKRFRQIKSFIGFMIPKTNNNNIRKYIREIEEDIEEKSTMLKNKKPVNNKIK